MFTTYSMWIKTLISNSYTATKMFPQNSVYKKLNSVHFWPSYYKIKMIKNKLCAKTVCINCITCNDSPSAPLLFNLAMCFAALCERGFKHEPTDVVAALKVCLSVKQLFLVKVRSDMRHLDVCHLWIQLSLINLHKKQWWHNNMI